MSLILKKPICLFIFVLTVGIASTLGGCVAAVHWLEAILNQNTSLETFHILRPRIVDSFLMLGMGISTMSAIAVSLFASIQARQRNLENHRHERDIRRQVIAAQAANAAKSEMLHRISHNIRSPITSILGMCEMLSDGQLSPEQQQRHAVSAKSSAEHLLALANELLDLARLEAGKIHNNQEVFDPAFLTHEVVESFQTNARAKKLDLSVHGCEPDSLYLNSDPTRLREILSNLIENAIKYTPEGSVSITLEPIQNSTYLRFVVGDTGPGISENLLPQLFEPFKQLDAFSSSAADGVGLGLTITKHLVESIGGTIEVLSTPGKGSTFIVELPGIEPTTHTPVTPPVTNKAEPTQQSPHHHRVLVIDDAPEVLRFFEATLLSRDIVAESALTAEDALQKCNHAQQEKNPFNCIFLDIQLGKTLGTALLCELRHITPEACIIAMTADTLPGAPARYAEYGFDGYLPKPFDTHQFDTLLEHMQDHFQRNAA